MPEKKSLQNLLESAARLRLSRLLTAAALIHILAVIAINVIGRYGLLPNTFDRYGIGISFAVDSAHYRKYDIPALINLFERDGLLAWVKDSTTFHVKLYSIFYGLAGGWLGDTTLAAEPLNLAYYLLILVFVFLLGREVFDRRVGLLSAGLVALWPSLLLHTTQLLRDPLFIASVLALLYVCAVLLNRKCSWKRAFALALGGAAAANIIWLIRSQMWEVLISISLLTLCLMLLRFWLKKPPALWNLLGCLLLLVIMLGLPQLGRRLNLYSYPANVMIVREQAGGRQEIVYVHRLPPGSSLPARISYLRAGFVTSYPGAGSNIDKQVEFKSIFDIVLYLPRAAAIGFLAPFPNMWFVNGPQVGFAGRVLSGAETLLMYAIELLALVCLWRGRRHLTAWLLFVAAGAGVIALGLVVSNIATLYRMRYAFWMLLIILGVKGALLLCDPNESEKAGAGA
jgi:hypothetical protein